MHAMQNQMHHTDNYLGYNRDENLQRPGFASIISSGI